MALHFGDVIVVTFPFTDQSAAKKRPAVVVSSDTYQRERPDVILLAITSQLRPALPGPCHTRVRKGRSWLREAPALGSFFAVNPTIYALAKR